MKNHWLKRKDEKDEKPPKINPGHHILSPITFAPTVSPSHITIVPSNIPSHITIVPSNIIPLPSQINFGPAPILPSYICFGPAGVAPSYITFSPAQPLVHPHP